ncbi:LysM peptidoglycan-binding domain-containing protein [Defluviitalea saccharophila]|uniref:LysM peptidoglycan-binding domain-containing protein n=1 Tax=Defluviitalea saccharophila TaxID=879970 RepID=A0ABZ2Y742_9FIRM
MGGKLEKAKIIPIDPVLGVPLPGSLTVMFNPSELKVTKQNKYVENRLPRPGFRHLKTALFCDDKNETCSFKLFFDTYDTPLPEAEKENVTKYTKKVLDLMAVKDLVRIVMPPKKCTFAWGSFQFQGYIQQVSQTFTKFTSQGTPVRAILEVTMIADDINILKGVTDLAQTAIDAGKNIIETGKTIATSVKQGDSLATIASKTLGSSESWRDVAESNNIVNPRIVEGVNLLIKK